MHQVPGCIRGGHTPCARSCTRCLVAVPGGGRDPCNSWLPVQACAERIKGDKTGEANCVGQYFDYWKCIDKCVAPKLFSLLK